MKIVCCKGYFAVKNTCQPKCDRGCENAKCVAPNVCECNEGYQTFSPQRLIETAETNLFKKELQFN